MPRNITMITNCTSFAEDTLRSRPMSGNAGSMASADSAVNDCIPATSTMNSKKMSLPPSCLASGVGLGWVVSFKIVVAFLAKQ